MIIPRRRGIRGDVMAQHTAAPASFLRGAQHSTLTMSSGVNDLPGVRHLTS
jgi:hypothetical protein